MCIMRKLTASFHNQAPKKEKSPPKEGTRKSSRQAEKRKADDAEEEPAPKKGSKAKK